VTFSKDRPARAGTADQPLRREGENGISVASVAAVSNRLANCQCRPVGPLKGAESDSQRDLHSRRPLCLYAVAVTRDGKGRPVSGAGLEPTPGRPRPPPDSPLQILERAPFEVRMCRLTSCDRLGRPASACLSGRSAATRRAKGAESEICLILGSLTLLKRRFDAAVSEGCISDS
jgi:hypothetical protein